MSHSAGIFTEKHVLVLTPYRPSGTFRLGMPHMFGEISRRILYLNYE